MRPVIALFASARRHGNTGRLMDRVARDVPVEVVDLAALRIAPYDYEHRHRDDDFEPLLERVLGHRQVIFASPVYWYSCSGPMKTFLDRITDCLDLPDLLDQGRRLRGKTGHVLCTSICDEVAPSFIASFRETFAYLGMNYGACLHANCEPDYHAEQYEPDVQRFVAQLARDAGR